EPAMCCSTGLCGVSVDPELLRLSTVISSLQKNGVEITRYNLTSAPMAFVNNKEVNRLITEKGVEVLPITVVDGAIVKTKAYPTNDEIISLLQVPRSYLGEQKTSAPKKNGGCNCKGGCC
ncbi:arsenite efflux transporter metallochaperone ArsD, partial [Phascolarctobacterium faecium]|uniref:arsenite efflux transporter metallochaperone ArsD n=2 Tax=Acidaminococcaceae TaxID=909930 RepID=UPI003AF14528